MNYAWSVVSAAVNHKEFGTAVCEELLQIFKCYYILPMVVTIFNIQDTLRVHQLPWPLRER